MTDDISPPSIQESPVAASELKKLRLEIEKLRPETAVPSKPLRHPTVVAALIVAAVTTIASVANIVVQIRFSSTEYQLAQIRTEKLQLEAAALEKRRVELDSAIAALQQGIRTLDLLMQGKFDQVHVRLNPCPPGTQPPCEFRFAEVPTDPKGANYMIIEPNQTPTPNH
ncbi:MAG: hypothetical protein ACHQPI_02890 [Thermoanaerobaculia bacterium]